ncbi:MAG: YdbL family protein [bacterium]|nr:YdbL family protein [bacterium]
MNRNRMKLLPVLAVAAAAAVAAASCVWRTEHKIETVSKIDAHIVIDIRQLKAEANQVEDYVRGGDAPAGGASAGEAPAGTVHPGDAASSPTTRLLDGARSVESASAAPSVAVVHPLAAARSAALARLDNRRPWWAMLSFATVARAAEPDGRSGASALDDDAAKKAAESRRARAKAVDEALTRGYVGENDRGYLTVLIDARDKDHYKPSQDLARDENADRKIIYEAIARDKKLTDPAPVESVFAATIREKLKKGQPFQAPRDKEAFKAFTDSKLGKRYPDAKPGQWLKII